MDILSLAFLFVMTVVVVGGTVWSVIQLTVPNEKDMALFASVIKVEQGIVSAYKVIECSCVGAYKAVEKGTVGAYRRIAHSFAELFLA